MVHSRYSAFLTCTQLKIDLDEMMTTGLRVPLSDVEGGVGTSGIFSAKLPSRHTLDPSTLMTTPCGSSIDTAPISALTLMIVTCSWNCSSLNLTLTDEKAAVTVKCSR